MFSTSVQELAPRWKILLLMIGPIAGILVILIPARVASFTVDALVDQLSVVLHREDRAPRWGRAIVSSIMRDKEICGGSAGLQMSDVRTANVRITFQTSIHLQKRRIAVTLESLDGSSLGQLYCSSLRREQAPSSLRLEFPAQQGSLDFTLPIDGAFEIGGAVSDDTPEAAAVALPLLIEGRIDMEAVSFPFKTGTVHSSADLTLGDVVSFVGNDGRSAAPATGLVGGSGSHLRVVAHAQARQAIVARRSHNSNSSKIMAPGIWIRAQAMSEWILIVTIGTWTLAGLRSKAPSTPDKEK